MSMATRNPTGVFVGLATLLGLAAGVIGYYTLSAQAARAGAGANSGLRDVVVTAADLTYGVKLESTMLRVVRYPKDAVPAGAFASTDSVIGQTTKVFLGAREPVTATKLSSRGGGLSMLVRPTMRAASIEVNQVSGVSGFVLPGHRVDVLTTVDPRNNGESAVTRTLLQNIEVLAAGQKTQQPDSRPITVQSVTVLVDPIGAEMVAHAQHEGEIHLVLRNPDDIEQVAVETFSPHQMMGNSAPSKPGPKPVVIKNGNPVVVAPAKSRDPVKVRIIRSANVTEQPAVTDTV